MIVTSHMQKHTQNSPKKSKQTLEKPSPAKIKRGPLTDRAWQRMLSGRRLDILDPSPLDIEIEDIAYGLARVSRWNGQTSGAHSLSVAQHSVMVEHLVGANAPKLDQKWHLAALLHDAPEYVIGDLITPFKHVLGGIYRDIEAGLDRAINIRFALPPVLPNHVRRTVKRADRMAAWLEATQLAGFSEKEAAKIFIKPAGTPANIKIKPQSPDDAAKAFLQRFSILGGYKNE